MSEEFEVKQNFTKNFKSARGSQNPVCRSQETPFKQFTSVKNHPQLYIISHNTTQLTNKCTQQPNNKQTNKQIIKIK